MLKYLGLLKGIYDRLKRAPKSVRDDVTGPLREALRTGTCPLGMRVNPANGAREYLWLVFDRSKWASAAELDRYHEANSPPGVAYFVRVL